MRPDRCYFCVMPLTKEELAAPTNPKVCKKCLRKLKRKANGAELKLPGTTLQNNWLALQTAAFRNAR